ncbi:MAG: GDP-mannose 4,6-dehydratase, partial [Bacteroidales bacterium]|nr:GDP-mannose 4,6-dehydratase [Bacteroidales bacterium]
IEYENFIFTSTSEIYGGKSIKPPFKEDDNFIPASPYSLSKYCAETSIKTFSEMYQKNYTILRLFNFYGPDMPNQFFIPQLISALKNNENFNMTKGKQVRDFLFINDIIQAMILSTDINAYNEVFNVCSGQGITLHDLALQLKMILNSKSKINFGAVPYRENEVWEMVGGNTKIKETLKFKQKYLLIEGLNNLL